MTLADRLKQIASNKNIREAAQTRVPNSGMDCEDIIARGRASMKKNKETFDLIISDCFKETRGTSVNA